MAEEPPVDPAHLPVAVARALRAEGVPVAPTSTAAFAAGLAELGLPDLRTTRWVAQATLVHHPEQLAALDRALAAALGGGPTHAPPVPAAPAVVADDGAEGGGAGPGGRSGPPARLVRASRQELLRTADLATCTEAELDEVARMVARFRFDAPDRPGRRPGRPAPGVPPHLGATARRAARTGGEPVALLSRPPRPRPRPLVLLLDVSGSMAPYARALLLLAHAAVAGRRRVEAFALGTRTTRLTPALAGRRPQRALDRAADAVPDWGGGTRLGDCLAAFLRRWGAPGAARGAVVVLLSDGWDRGDPEHLARQVARLRRLSHRLVWVNPLRATPGYEPLARGMAAALPHVDHFVDGHSVAALDDLAHLIARLSAGRGPRPSRRAPAHLGEAA